VLAANGADVMIDQDGGYAPTPVLSHAILIDICSKGNPDRERIS